MSAVACNSLTFNNGLKVPSFGLGTWKSKPGEVQTAVELAIDAGYRHIDCAAVYGNEKEVGNAFKIKIGVSVKREDIFVTSKLWNTNHKAENVRPACVKTLTDLQLDYVDLYLIHWPNSFAKQGDVIVPRDADGNLVYADVSLKETWAAMEKLVEEGLVKSIGLSNFNSEQIDEVIANATIKPAMLQIEVHPYLSQQPLIDHCKKYNIHVTGYSPLGSSDRPWKRDDHPVLMQDEIITAIAKNHNKSNAQVLIRWQLQRDLCVIPKSVNPDRIVQNSQVFDFELSGEEMDKINNLNRDYRYCVLTTEVNGKIVARDAHRPDYPFNIPF